MSCLLLTISPVVEAANAKNSPLPVFFFGNTGLAPTKVKFIARTPELSAYFSQSGVTLRLRGTDFNVSFPGSNPNARLETNDRFSGTANFFVGDDPARWTSGVNLYQSVIYRNLYPGIDMRYGGTDHLLKSEFILDPGADPKTIKVQYAGFEKITLGDKGSLRFQFPSGELREEAPVAYQVFNGKRKDVNCWYDLRDDGSIRFSLGAYDSSKELVIDPVISYSTYLGGSGSDAVTSVVVDSVGNAYVTGYTDSIDFPVAGAAQGATGGGVDAFIAKLNPAGNALVYATYIGGSGDDRARGIVLDASGNVTITGTTTSTNFPRAAAFQSTLLGGRDAFVTKLNATGTLLVYSTYFGGSGYDNGNGIATDSAGNVYIAGDTYSTDFPLLGAQQSSNHGRQDGFVAKFTATGVPQYSTYLGGSGDDRAMAIAVDSTGAAYVTGNTTSPDFPIANSYQAANAGGQDIFVTKYSPAGSTCVYSTYLGGSGGIVGYPESGNAIAVDAAGSAYVTGVTSSQNFPTIGALQTRHAGGGLDAFISKFSAAGSALVYSTYLGGIGLDTATAIAIDGSGNAYVTGTTTSPDFPMLTPLQSVKAGSVDAFVAAVNPAGSALVFSTFFGGNAADGGTAIALNGSGTIWIAGQTTSTNFPVQLPFQTTGYPEGNGFIASMTQAVAQKASMLTPTPSSTLTGATVTFTWTNAGASMYWLDVGTVFTGGDVTTGNVGTATSKTVTGIPTDGSTVYVRLWTNISGAWKGFDYTYTAATLNTPRKAAMISPVPSSTLTGSTVTFTWNNTNATMYWLDVGTAFTRGDITTGNVGSVTSKTVTGIPTDASTIYVRLWTMINGNWQGFDYTYTAANGLRKAAIISPVPSTTLTNSTVTFIWNDTGASMYWLDVGTGFTKGDITTGNVGTATSKVVAGLPTDGSTVYVRLWTYLNGTWQGFDYTYTAVTTNAPRKAAMISPVPSTKLTGSTVTFTWNNSNAIMYWLDVGTAFTKGDITTGNVGAATSKTVSGIPMNGSTIYVRLWTMLNGTWQGFDYTYTAATIP